MALGGGGGGAAGVRAGRAYVELSAKDNLTAHLKKVAGKFAELGKSALALTGIGGLVGGLVGGLSFKSTVDDVRKMNDAVKALGLSAAGGSGLFGVLNQFSDVGENIEGLTQFSQKVQDAVNGVGEEPKKLFEGLSVSAKDLIDLPLDEKFLKIHEAIRQLPQAQQQFKLSMLGGTDSMKKWLPLLDMSNEQLREQAKQLAFTNSELEDASRASKAMQQAGGALNRVWQQAAIALAPLVADLAKMGAEALKPVGEWLKGRTLQDLWDELVARGQQAWVEIKIAFGSTFADIWDFFKSGWNSAVYVVKTLFADLAEFVSKALTEALQKPLMVLSVLKPELANALRAGLAAGGVAAGGMRGQAQKEFDAAEADIRQGQKDRETTKGRLRGEAQAKLDAIAARVEERRRKQAWDDLMQTTVALGGLAGRVAAVGRSVGVLGGGGAFLRQGFGFQGSDSPAKQMVKEQKTTNAKLGDLVKAVTGIGFPRFL